MRLIGVAHGTRLAAGNRVAARLTALAGARLGVGAEAAYVELCAPLLGEVLARLPPEEPAVVVPLLLSTGYHVRVDLPAALALCAAPASLARLLGPDPLLARAQADRLRAAGAVPGQPVTMVAAGSQDPAARADLDAAADLLRGAWGGPVRLAVLGGPGPRVEHVLQPGDAVSPYLLADGYFSSRCADLARSAGGTPVADVIGAHPAVAELVAERAQAAMPVSV